MVEKKIVKEFAKKLTKVYEVSFEILLKSNNFFFSVSAIVGRNFISVHTFGFMSWRDQIKCMA